MKPSSQWPSETVLGHLLDAFWGLGGVIMPRGRGSDDSLIPRCVDASDVPIRYLHAVVEVTYLWKRSCICDQECELRHQDATTISKCL